MKAIVLLLVPAILAGSCARPPEGLAMSPGGSPTLSPAWSVPLDVAPDMGILPVDAGRVLVAARPASLVLLEEAGGALLWRKDLERPFHGSPVLIPGSGPVGPLVALSMENDEIELVSLRDGALFRRWPLGWEDPLLSGAGGGLLAHSSDGRIALFDPSTGKALWQSHLPPIARTAAVWCGGRILVGLEDGQLLALEPATGRVAWRERLPFPPAGTPTCSARDLFLVTRDNQLHALRLGRRNARLRWSARTGADPAGPVVALEDSLLLFSKDTYAYGFHRRNGHLIFRTRLARRPGPPAVLGNLVLVAGPHVTRLDAFTLPEGRNAGGFELPAGNRFLTPPVIAGSRVILGVARYGEESSRVIALEISAPKGKASPPPGGGGERR